QADRALVQLREQQAQQSSAQTKQADSQLAQLTAKLAATAQAKATLEKQQQQLADDQQKATAALQATRERETRLTAENQRLQSDLTAAQEAAEKIRTQREQADSALTQLRAQQKNQPLQSDVQKADQHIVRLESELAATGEAKAALEKQQQRLAEEQKKTAADLKATRDQATQLTAENQRLQNDLAAARKDAEKIRTQREQADSALVQLREQQKNQAQQNDLLVNKSGKELVQLTDNLNKVTQAKALLEKQHQQLLKKQEEMLNQNQELTEKFNELTQETKILRNASGDADTKTIRLATLPGSQLRQEQIRKSYAIGVSLGREINQMRSTNAHIGEKTDATAMLNGVVDGVFGQIRLSTKELDTTLNKASQNIRHAVDKVVSQEEKAGNAYVANFKKQKGVKQSPVGYWYRINKSGDNNITGNPVVDITIKESLSNGKIIKDMQTEGGVLALPLKSYPPIFQDAIRKSKNHGVITMVVPPELAYGDQGAPPEIPPQATMVYEVEVLGVRSGQ
ncbi:FKBP-type peptidyl-prolyl cis-trans isomerase N-terminal domain-containing protein, partial [Enterobacteriaceae bacterium LUAb1]